MCPREVCVAAYTTPETVVVVPNFQGRYISRMPVLDPLLWVAYKVLCAVAAVFSSYTLWFSLVHVGSLPAVCIDYTVLCQHLHRVCSRVKDDLLQQAIRYLSKACGPLVPP